MTNYERRRVFSRMAMSLRCFHPKQRMLTTLALGWFGAASACSLQDLDYLSTELVAPDAGSANFSEVGVGGGKATGGVNNSAAGQTASAAAGGQVATAASGGATSSSTVPTRTAPAGPYAFSSVGELSAWKTDVTSALVTWVSEGQAVPLGAMQVVTTESSNARLDVNLLDVRGFVLKARVRSVTPNATVKPFMTGGGWIWADGGQQAVAASWTTVTIDPANLSYDGGGFDPKQIVNFGLGFSANATFVVDALWFE